MAEDRKKETLETSETLPFIEKPFVISQKLKDSAEDGTEREEENEDTSCGFWIFRGPFMQR